MADEMTLSSQDDDSDSLNDDPILGLERLQHQHLDLMQETIAKLSMHEEVVEQFPGGICAFDKDLNMTICNQRLKSIMGYSEDLFAHGLPTIEQLFRFKAGRGEYGPGDVEEHVASRMRLVEQARPHRYERVTAEGRVIEVRGRPLDSGGFVTTYIDITEERDQTYKLQNLIESFPGGIGIFDRESKLIISNDQFRSSIVESEKLFQTESPDLKAYFWHNAKHGEYGAGNIAEIVTQRLSAVASGKSQRYERNTPGRQVIEVTSIPLEDGGMVETHVDVTIERARAFQLESFLANVPCGIALFDADLKLTICNQNFREFLQYPEELCEGSQATLTMQIAFDVERGEIQLDGVEEKSVSDHIENLLRQAKLSSSYSLDRLRGDGTALETQIVALEDGGFMFTYSEITDRLKGQAEAIRLATHSELTGLPNRNLFQDRLEIALAQAERGSKMALLLVDIHDFQSINGVAGNKTGDLVLNELGQRFNQMRRDTDTIAHLGGDEFVVIQVGIDGLEGAEILARRLIRTIREPMEIDGMIFELNACIGIALSPEDGTFSDQVLTKANIALGGAKDIGPGMIRHFKDFSNRIAI